MADERINIDINATDNVTGPSRRVIKALDDIGDKATGSAVKTQALGESLDDVGGADVSAKLRAAEKRIKELGDESAKSAAKVQALETRMNKLNRTGVAGAGKKGFFGAGIKAGFSFSKMFKLILIPAIFDAVGAVATLGSALGAMGAAGIGALGPILGLLPGALGYVTALGQGFAAVKLGLSGMGDAIKALSNPEASPEELAKALENLGPKSQQLAKQIVKLQEPFKGLKRTVGNQLAPGFTKLTKAARGYLPVMEKALAGTAKVFSGAASSMAATLATGSTKSMVGSIMGTNTRVLAQLTQALVPMFRTVLRLVEAAGPMMLRFAQDFGLFIQHIENSVGPRASLVDFYDKTYTVTKGLIKWTADLGMALFNIFKIGAGLGGEMGQSLLQMNENFRRFTESVEGKASIKNWFETMKPIIYEVGYLIRDISKGLAGVSMDETLLGTLQTLRNDTLPALIGLMESASGKFLPTIARIVGTLANIMIETNVFPVILEGIARSLEIIASIIQGLPGPIKQLLGYMVTLSSVIKFGGMIGFFKLFGAGAGNSATKVGMLTKAFGGLKSGLRTSGVFLADWIGGTTTLGTGMRSLGTAAQGAGAKFMAAFGTKAGALALLAIAAAALSARANLAALREQVQGLLTDLRTTGSPEAFAAVQDQMNSVLPTSMSDYIMGGDAPLDAFRFGGWLLKTPGGDPGPLVLTAQERREAYDQMRRTSDEIRLMQRQAAGDVFKDDIDMTDMWGNSTSTWPTEFIASDEQVKQIQDIAQQAGVDWSQGYDVAIEKIRTFKNVNIDAQPAVAGLYNALDTLGNSASTAGDRVGAFESALGALTTIWTGGGVRDAAVNTAKGLDQVRQAAQGADVSMRNGKLVWKAAAQDNWALNDALTAQAGNLNQVAVRTFEETDSVGKSVDAYKRKWKSMVDVLEQTTGNRKAARLLAQEYALTPKEIKTAFSMPGFKEWLAEAPRSYQDIKNKIEGNPITIGVKIKNQFKRKGKFGLGGMSNIGIKTQQTVGIGVSVQDKNAKDKLTDLQDAVKWFNVNGANVQVNHGQVDSAFTKLDDLRTKALAMKDVEIDIGVRVGTATRAEGGPVFAGSKYLVGERGPEALLTASGVEMIGTHGSEYRTFADDGFVIPNHALPTAEVPVSTSARASAEYLETSSGGGTVYIGTINAHTPMDVVREVQRGMEKAQRNSKERK